MTSSAFWAFGSKLQYGDAGTPETFVDIAEVTKIKFSGLDRDDIDVTNHSSPGGGQETLPGLRKWGEVVVEANWLPTNATQNKTTGILASFSDNSYHNFKIILPNTLDTIAFSGYISKFDPGELDVKTAGTLSFTVKLASMPTFTY